CTTKEDAVSDIRLKWNPPTRESASVEWLWRLPPHGKNHPLGSDHAPPPKAGARGIWGQAPGPGQGGGGCFSVVRPQRRHRRDISLPRIAELVSGNPSRIFNLHPRKGEIALGADADFAVIETNGRRTLDARDLEYHDQEKWSPFDGYELRVYPIYTVLRGKVIYAEGEVAGQPGGGEYLAARTAAAV